MTDMLRVESSRAPPAGPAEAVAHWRALSREHPGQFDRQLATSLAAYAHSQAVSGDAVGALATGREALDLWQRLNEASPSFEPQLGNILFAVSVYLAKLGNVELARSMAEDAVRFWRKASTVDSSRRVQLAAALQQLSTRYNQNKMWRQSLTSEREAIAIKRELLGGGGQANKAFAKDLDRFVNRLVELGEAGEAIVVAKEAADQWRRLAADDPDGSSAGHAAALRQLGSLLGERPVTAPEAAREARPVLKEARHLRTQRALRWLTRAFGIRQAK